jgi:murein L,D-transpeptidase YafK
MRKFKLLVVNVAITFLAMPLFISSKKPNESFLKNQLEFKRVKDAYTTYNESILKKLKVLNIDKSNFQILFIAYKANKKLEIYVGNPEKQMSLFKIYNVCAQSGEIGPKNQSGDNQTPEGFYYINRFNPASNFHLSLGLNYPNQADKTRSNAADLGGDIFIHGNCVSIGCLAMTDDVIKEIYTLAIMAKNVNQSKIPVIIAPFNFRLSENANFEKKAELKAYSAYFGLWTKIHEGLSTFHTTKQMPKFTIGKTGSYILKN